MSQLGPAAELLRALVPLLGAWPRQNLPQAGSSGCLLSPWQLNRQGRISEIRSTWSPSHELSRQEEQRGPPAHGPVSQHHRWTGRTGMSSSLHSCPSQQMSRDGQEASGRSRVYQPEAGPELQHGEPEAAALSAPPPGGPPGQELGEFFYPLEIRRRRISAGTRGQWSPVNQEQLQLSGVDCGTGHLALSSGTSVGWFNWDSQAVT